MTEFGAIAALSSIAAVVAIAAFIQFNSKRNLARLREYEFFSDAFFKAANTLTNANDIPDELLSHLALLNSSINDERAAKRFFSVWQRVVRERIEDGRPGQMEPELQAFINANRGLDKVVVEAFMSGMLAMTFLNNWWGIKYRAMMADIYAREKQPVTAIRAFKESQLNSVLPLPAAA